MPGGGGPTAFVAFGAVKYAGYSLAGFTLNRVYSLTDRNALLVGAVRTAIGLAAGFAFGSIFLWGAFARNMEWLFFAGLVPVRILEWGLLIRLFYEPRFLVTGRAWRWSLAGLGWSFLLDIIGILLALVVPGGIWIC